MALICVFMKSFNLYPVPIKAYLNVYRWLDIKQTINGATVYRSSRIIPEVKIYHCYATHKKFGLNRELYVM